MLVKRVGLYTSGLICRQVLLYLLRLDSVYTELTFLEDIYLRNYYLENFLVGFLKIFLNTIYIVTENVATGGKNSSL